MDYGLLAFSLASFAFITFAAFQIGQLATRFHLPLISGYLLAGILAGPFILQRLFMDAIHVAHVGALRFLDETALAFIAFVAGSEMALDELRGRYRSIGWNTAAQIGAVYIVSGIGIFLLAEHIPFMRDLTPAGKLADGAAGRHDPGGALTLVGQSPSSTRCVRAVPSPRRCWASLWSPMC